MDWGRHRQYIPIWGQRIHCLLEPLDRFRISTEFCKNHLYYFLGIVPWYLIKIRSMVPRCFLVLWILFGYNHFAPFTFPAVYACCTPGSSIHWPQRRWSFRSDTHSTTCAYGGLNARVRRVKHRVYASGIGQRLVDSFTLALYCMNKSNASRQDKCVYPLYGYTQCIRAVLSVILSRRRLDVGLTK